MRRERLNDRAVARVHTDIAVIGGGIMGSALAYWLTELDREAGVTVIERDPSYARASSALSAASIRQQFATPINVRISQQSIEFLRSAGERLGVDGEPAEIGLVEGGYLYLAGPEGLPALRAAHAIQRAERAPIALLDPLALAKRFPWLALDGIEAGTFGERGEGWFDGYGLLRCFARKARSQGARYLRGEVTGLKVRNHRLTGLHLADGMHLGCDFAVNAAGPWARAIAALAGIELPVSARRRTVFAVSTPNALPPLPLLIDKSGFWLRPEGRGYIGAPPPADDPDDAPLEPELGRFETDFWPLIAARIPAFEEARLERAWAGYYDFNTFDQNGILGMHPSIDNLVFMNGFSGHGMQQAPVVGRGTAELILTGRYVSLDLADLGIGRLIEGQPLTELNVIG
jgi:FAD-dependent oxidoreductase domain-containing protein 1